jgi:hypothetical protein
MIFMVNNIFNMMQEQNQHGLGLSDEQWYVKFLKLYTSLESGRCVGKVRMKIQRK